MEYGLSFSIFPIPRENAIAGYSLTAPVAPTTAYTDATLVNAENLSITGMTSVPVGTTLTAGQYSFDQTTEV